MDENLTEDDPLLHNTKPLFENINYNFNYFRKVIILIDMSENLSTTDFKPNRQKFLFGKLEQFINNFFKNNFLSSIAIVKICDYFSQVVTPFLEDPAQLISLLNSNSQILGACSLFNGLNVKFLTNFLEMQRNFRERRQIFERDRFILLLAKFDR